MHFHIMITDFGGQNILAMTELFSKEVPVELMPSNTDLQ